MQTQQPSQVVITAAARSNDAFRREVMTGDHQQVVLMTIPPEARLDGTTSRASRTISCSSVPGPATTS